LIFRKINNNVATRCHILKLKCAKFDFGWGFAPGPAGGAYSAPPDPLAGFKGPTSKGKRGGEWKGKKKKDATGTAWIGMQIELCSVLSPTFGFGGQHKSTSHRMTASCVPTETTY